MSFLEHPVPVIVDASVSVDLAVGGRPGTPERVMRWVEEGRMLLTPAIHWPEAGHAILRQLGGDSIAAGRRLEIVEATGIETADRGPEGVRMAMALAERHGLSVYDGTYLWLAIDIDGELATFDKGLARAAAAEGVPLAIPV